MHKISALPGGWNPHTEGVILIEQSPAPIIFLTYADTDIQTLAATQTILDDNFPTLRVANLLNLQQQLSIDIYLENVVSQAKIVILRLLGGSTYWSYGFERIKEVAQEKNIALLILPGDNTPDLDLISHSTVSLGIVNQLWRYLIEGGTENFLNALQYISDIYLQTNYHPEPPKSVPELGTYTWKASVDNSTQKIQYLSTKPGNKLSKNDVQIACGILFYRSHYLAGNTAPIDALCKSLAARNFYPLPIFIASLRDRELQQQLLALLKKKILNYYLILLAFP